MMNIETVDLTLLSSVTGGQAGPMGPMGQMDGPSGPRSWKQIGKEYAQACVQGAGQNAMMSLAFGGGGGPAGLAASAGIGCAMGVGMKALDDGTNYVFGTGQ